MSHLFFATISDDFLMGTSAEIYMLQNAASVFPSEVIMKSKFFFIGRILQLLEVQCPTPPLHLLPDLEATVLLSPPTAGCPG